MHGSHLRRSLFFALMVVVGLLHAEDRPLRVAVLTDAPPMSYVDAAGNPAGFNVGIAQALCEVMEVRCLVSSTSLQWVVDAVANGEFDFAVVSLLATPERRAKVLFTKPYYRSNSVWFAPSGIKPGEASVVTVAGSAQYQFARSQGWKVSTVRHHSAFPALLESGAVGAVLVPMATALSLRQEPAIRKLGLTTTVMQNPELSGDVCISVHPKAPELRDRLDRAIDRIKRDGRFDRLNTEYIPFRLQ